MGTSGFTTRFGDFLLDAANFELRRHDRAVKLERRAMDLLIVLVERRGQLVSRAEIVERLWGTDVFIDVDSGVNTVVRKVRLALRDDADAPRYIETVAGRGYRFIAPIEVVPAAVVSRAAEPPVPTDVSDPAALPTSALLPALHAPDALGATATAPWRGIPIWVLPAVLALVGFAMWRPGSAELTPPPAQRMVPLTTLSGLERGATFSPDGRQVAFTWSGNNQDNWDVYVSLVGSADVRRMTTGSARDSAPRWSPDGRYIAYAQSEGAAGTETLRVMSALGGSDRRVGDFAVQTTSAWSPDGRYLVTGRAKVPDEATPTGLYLLPLDGSEPRRITTPSGAEVDWMPDFSPDGRRLAYASCLDPVFRSDCHILVLDLDATFAPRGDARRLTQTPFWGVRGVTWSRDGASIIYGVEQAGTHSLWRVDAEGRRPPEPIETGGQGAFPRVAPSGDLAFTRKAWDTDIHGLTGGHGG